MISFSVPAVPIALPRQRHRVVKQAGKAPWVQNYLPSDHPIQAFKATIRLAFQKAYQGAPMEGPIVFRALFLMPRPGRLLKKKSPQGRIPHTTSPDKSNLEKGLEDALKGLAWVDDCQVFDGRSKKMYVAIGEQPGCYVEIEQLAEPKEGLFQ